MEDRSNQGFLEKVFHLSENHTNVKTKVTAGITTFMTVAYILAVNPNILSAMGMNRGAVFTATALASLVATLLMAAPVNYPFMLAPNMGLNAYFTHTVVLQMGYIWQMALVAISVEGLILIAPLLTSVREAIFNTVPMNLKRVVPVGIRLFIALIGLWDAETMVESVTLVSVFSFKGSLEAETPNSVGTTILLALVGVLITGILVVENIEGNILWGILITWISGIICEVTGLYQSNVELEILSILPDFSGGFDIQSMAPIFFKMDLSGTLPLNFVTIMFVSLFAGMFDTLGTPIGMAPKADTLDKNGELPKIRGAPLSDAIDTPLGAVFGTSTTTIFVKSVSGIVEGGRTGLTSVVTAISLGLSLFLPPVFSAIPSFVTVPALIIVGFLTISSALEIDFNDLTEVIPSYIAIIAMSFMYSISEDIAMGITSHVAIGVVTGRTKGKKIGLLMYVLMVLLVPKYILIQNVPRR